MNDLIVIPFHDFKTTYNGFRTRDAHLYEHFMRSSFLKRVVIINRPTSLIEIILRRKRLRSKGEVVYKKNNIIISKYSDKTFIVDVFVFDVLKVVRKRHSWLPDVYSRKSIVSKINAALDFLKITEAGVYMSSPFSVKLGNKIPSAKFKMLDAVDNFLKYKEWKYFHETIEDLYEEAKATYDLIYVNSSDSYKIFNRSCSANLMLVPNGVDTFRFRGDFSRPRDLPKGKLIVGYAGKIQRMFNAGLLAKMADQNPNINFVLLGKFLDKEWERNNWTKMLSKYENIFFLGEKNYDILPSYYHYFDIGMIPYHIQNQHGGDPIKFYEYMAAGLPIISTDIGNIYQYRNKTIRICNSDNDFLAEFSILLENFKGKENYDIPHNLEWKSVAENLLNDLFSE